MSPLTVVSPYGPAAASHRIRALAWLDHLGVEAEVVDYLGHGTNTPGELVRAPVRVVRAETTVRRSDLGRGGSVLVHREASPLSRGGVEAGLLRRAEHGVYDFDDALQWVSRESPLRRVFAKSRKCLAAVRSADVVIAGNPLLAEWAAQWADDVVVIPTCIEPDDYPAKQSYAVGDRPRLLWVGSPSAEPQLHAAAPALLELARRTGAVLRVVSSGAADLGPLTPIVERVDWSPAGVGTLGDQADIAIAPLFDGIVEEGKCAYKILQYGAMGLPVVGSPVGANRRVLDLVGGLAAHDTGEWLSGLTHWLDASAEVRSRAGARARAAVSSHYSYSTWSSVWRTAVGV